MAGNDVLFLRGLEHHPMVVAVATVDNTSSPPSTSPDYRRGLPYIGGRRGRSRARRADVPSERRGVSIRDDETGEVVDLTVFSGYVDDGERLAVEYLPHTGYGAIVERG